VFSSYVTVFTNLCFFAFVSFLLLMRLHHAGALKMREWKMQEWKLQEKTAGVEIAGVEEAGVDRTGGICRSGKSRSR